jgi:hypothetical protein
MARSLMPRTAKVAREEKRREAVLERDFFKELILLKMPSHNFKRRTIAFLSYDLQAHGGAILGKT